jgi:hypothetical protein
MKNRRINQELLDIEFKQDYLNVPQTVAISSEGVIFMIGDVVKHDDDKKETAVITKFTVDTETIDVIAHTTKGIARISFLYHI